MTTKVIYKGETRRIPNRYLPKTLTPYERRKQIASIFTGTDRPKVSIKPRRSSWTVLFNKKYKPKSKKLEDISNVTNIPLGALNAVFRKGQGAYYNSGSRPNQTPESWAYGRIFAYIMGGKNVRKVDRGISVKYKVKFQEKTKY